ncbi:MAG: hypothetical protein LUE16_01595 [Lachnospiraceae bacterium]|nr:hypothetical protein [Lachnospiraceae bacterium]
MLRKGIMGTGAGKRGPSFVRVSVVKPTTTVSKDGLNLIPVTTGASRVIVRSKRKKKGEKGYRDTILLLHLPEQVKKDFMLVCRKKKISGSLVAQVYAQYVVDNRRLPFTIDLRGYKTHYAHKVSGRYDDPEVAQREEKKKINLTESTLVFSFPQKLKDEFAYAADELLCGSTALLRSLMLYVASTGEIPAELQKKCRPEQYAKRPSVEFDPSVLDEQ